MMVVKGNARGLVLADHVERKKMSRSLVPESFSNCPPCGSWPEPAAPIVTEVWAG